jgi:hypothetical protein
MQQRLARARRRMLPSVTRPQRRSSVQDVAGNPSRSAAKCQRGKSWLDYATMDYAKSQARRDAALLSFPGSPERTAYLTHAMPATMECRRARYECH